MSLLLDALRPEPQTPAVTEPEEEPLDAHATLELLDPKLAANEALTLEPPTEAAAAARDIAASYSAAPHGAASLSAAPEGAASDIPAPAIAASEAVAEIARPSPISARSPVPPAEPAPEPTAPKPGAAARPSAPALDAAPDAHRKKKFGLLLAVAVLAAIAVLGKSWWWPSANPVSYPEPQPEQSAAPQGTTPTPASTHAVQVPSARPADQFAYTGNAPEIDLQAADASPIVASTSPIVASTSLSNAPATSPAAKPAGARRRSKTPHLSVTRAQGLAPVDAHVQAGYGALASGDVGRARDEYLAALDLDPNNVDGLLGAASVAVREGKPALAAEGYAKVLRLEPGNPDATAAMAMLGESASELTESRLKILIATDGSRPALHAALAGVYAAQGRWGEATQEYFTALAKDPGNPDLAFNVAASLDQNRNVAMALTYYGQALAFARQRPAQINLRAVEQRIKQLKARAEVQATAAPVAP